MLPVTLQVTGCLSNNVEYVPTYSNHPVDYGLFGRLLSIFAKSVTATVPRLQVSDQNSL
jgi:hypothetical protein